MYSLLLRNLARAVASTAAFNSRRIRAGECGGADDVAGRSTFMLSRIGRVGFA